MGDEMLHTSAVLLDLSSPVVLMSNGKLLIQNSQAVKKCACGPKKAMMDGPEIAVITIMENWGQLKIVEMETRNWKWNLRVNL